ncbi:DNA polymerase III subunit alpha [Mannheimia haemolytica]|uniref:DNA polymerase III subunit alpha n=1 Tax=Mannheimia haemolytica TaxID=75985 RepID=A0A378N9G4_MANHA|nr:DNA polymerase III subunit alpha [Mannheimia haemolytica]
MASRVAVTKRGSRIGIATIEDRSGKLDITLFSEALENFGHLMQQDKLLWQQVRYSLMISAVD